MVSRWPHPQANEKQKASPLVVEIDGERRCTGSEILSEQDWVDAYARHVADPSSNVKGVCLPDGRYATMEWRAAPQGTCPLRVYILD